MSMSESSGFGLLHEKVRRWIWARQWTSLRDIQERAITPILAGDKDIVISAATAADKGADGRGCRRPCRPVRAKKPA